MENMQGAPRGHAVMRAQGVPIMRAQGVPIMRAQGVPISPSTVAFPLPPSFSTTASRMHALRLTPGSDLKQSLAAFVKQQEIKAGYVATAVGSLRRTSLRMADGKTAKEFDGNHEICSLVGTLGEGGLHLHVSLSDGEGRMVGGHLLDGCHVNTTAELVIGELGGLVFTRPFDEETGYGELSVQEGEAPPARQSWWRGER